MKLQFNRDIKVLTAKDESPLFRAVDVDAEEVLKLSETLEYGDGNSYTASDGQLERLAAVGRIGREVFAELPVQAGWSFGNGKKMNGVEWHKSSEVVIAATDCVLILGESGTGKEHIAERIHSLSKRSGKPFVSVDCGLLSKELAASVLFGHEKGAFTGADTKREGYWEEADGGTLFLDEIGNLPPEVQQMMLRALESRGYRPVGGNKDRIADVRIIAATNEDLLTAIAEKRFRQDLFHRIKEYSLNIPPLRECHEDIIPLANFFLNMANREFGKHVKGFDAETRKRMLAHSWGGNVRELRGVIRSAVLFTDGEVITADKLEFEEPLLPANATLSLKNEETEKKQILCALEQAEGNRSLAAQLLGIGRTTLYNKLKTYGIE